MAEESKPFSLWWPLGLGVLIAIGGGIFYVSRGGEWTWTAIAFFVFVVIFPTVRVYGRRKGRQMGQDLRAKREARRTGQS